MWWDILDWILESKSTLKGELVKSLVNSIIPVLNISFDKCVKLYKMLHLGKAKWRVYRNSLYYLYNSSVNLKLF